MATELFATSRLKPAPGWLASSIGALPGTAFRAARPLRRKPARRNASTRADAASVMFAKTDAAASRHVGINGGTAAGLVGSYDTVAARILAFHAVGIELFMLQFQPFEAEMRRFAGQVMPRVR